MRMPTQPVSLNVEQIAELNQKLSAMRHDINNHLALIMAAVELIQYKPESVEKMMETLYEQPTKISDSMGKFSDDFEKMFGISKL